MIFFHSELVLSSDSLHYNTAPINRPSPQEKFILDSRVGTRSVDGRSVLMEGVRGQHEHHNKQSNDKEESKGCFAIYFLQLLQPYASAMDVKI